MDGDHLEKLLLVKLPRRIDDSLPEESPRALRKQLAEDFGADWAPAIRADRCRGDETEYGFSFSIPPWRGGWEDDAAGHFQGRQLDVDVNVRHLIHQDWL